MGATDPEFIFGPEGWHEEGGEGRCRGAGALGNSGDSGQARGRPALTRWRRRRGVLGAGFRAEAEAKAGLRASP